MSIYSHIWLGSDTDPQPVFRDEAPEGVRAADGTLREWPDAAAIAVEFTAERFPSYLPWWPQQLGVRFFSRDGWVLDLPEALRKAFDPRIRKDFQIEPIAWEDIVRDGEWRLLLRDPFYLARTRIELSLTLNVEPSLPLPQTPS